jgi:CMP-N,N'-diacetyllegionaminic acid synthase
MSEKQNTVVALIPARSGSKRVPDKNIRPLAGHPVIAYTI